jgi:hypothetical protein
VPSIREDEVYLDVSTPRRRALLGERLADRGGRWKVARDTLCTFRQMTGVDCSRREER